MLLQRTAFSLVYQSVFTNLQKTPYFPVTLGRFVRNFTLFTPSASFQKLARLCPLRATPNQRRAQIRRAPRPTAGVAFPTQKGLARSLFSASARRKAFLSRTSFKQTRPAACRLEKFRLSTWLVPAGRKSTWTWRLIPQMTSPLRAFYSTCLMTATSRFIRYKPSIVPRRQL